MFTEPFFNRNRWLQLFLFRKKEYIVFKNSWYTNGLFIVLNAKVREFFYLDLVTYSWSFLRTIVYHEWRLLNFVLCSKNLNEVISFYEWCLLKLIVWIKTFFMNYFLNLHIFCTFFSILSQFNSNFIKIFNEKIFVVFFIHISYIATKNSEITFFI